MTEETNNEQNQDNNVSDEGLQSQNSEHINDQGQNRNQKPIFSRDQLAALTSDAKKKAYEQARKEIMEEFNKGNIPSNQGVNPQPSVSNNQPQQTNMSPENLDKLIEEQINRRAQRMEFDRASQQLVQKLDAAPQKYPDFNEKVSKLNLEKNLPIALWANNLPNTAEVLYEMASNPAKFAQVIGLVNSGTPQLAVDELQKLSKSIEDNEKAAQQKFPNEPFGQLKPSTNGLDNGSLTVSSIRKLPGMKV